MEIPFWNFDIDLIWLTFCQFGWFCLWFETSFVATKHHWKSQCLLLDSWHPTCGLARADKHGKTAGPTRAASSKAVLMVLWCSWVMKDVGRSIIEWLGLTRIVQQSIYSSLYTQRESLAFFLWQVGNNATFSGQMSQMIKYLMIIYI